MLRKFTTFLAVVMCASSASAANLVVNQGSAKVVSGGVTTTVFATANVQPGDTVQVGGNNSATVYYSDACYVPVTPEASHTVVSNAPCMGAASVGSGGIPSGTLVAGGLVIAGGVGAAIALSGRGSDSP